MADTCPGCRLKCDCPAEVRLNLEISQAAINRINEDLNTANNMIFRAGIIAGKLEKKILDAVLELNIADMPLRLKIDNTIKILKASIFESSDKKPQT